MNTVVEQALTKRFGSGQSVRRVEDRTLVQGQGQFAGDASMTGQTWLKFVRSPMPHAIIRSIHCDAAKAMPGVLAVITGQDLVDAGVKPIPGVAGFKRADGTPAATAARRGLAHERVRHVGEALACVIALTPEEAAAAALAIEVDYEALESVANPHDAMKAGAPVLCEAAPDNVSAVAKYGDVAAVDAAFARARHVVSLSIENQRLIPAPMEPRSTLAWYDAESGRITMRMSTQMPAGVRNSLCDAVLGLPRDKVRILASDVGGGFGGKTGIYPEDVVLAHAARVLGRPVKWIAERSEEFLSATHGRDIDSCAQMALDAEGKILALRVHTVANVGAYALGAGVAIQVMIGPWVQTSVYDIQTIDFQYTAVMTNTTPTGPYRGAGRPEAIYIIERLMEAAARKIGIDGAELRLKNMIQPDQFPYKNAMGQVYDSGNFPSMTRQACELADWSGFEARYQDSLRRGQWRGRGIASFLEWTGGNALEETVRVTVAADGYIEIVSATMPMGQGIATTYVQLAVDAFGVPVEKIRIIQGDTDRAEGFGSAGSRSLFTGGSAIEVAAHKVIDKAKEIAADALEVAQQDLVYGEGRFQVMGTDRGIGLFEVAARSDSGHIQLDSSTKVAGPSWPNACHICEVEIDPETMEVSLIAYASMNDVGRVVNPMIVRGQLDGGAVQGIGQALTEAMVYDASAQPLSASFLDYAMPRADLIGRFKTEMDQTVPCKNNPLGVKGVGELGTIGATPALVNAVADALARAGHG
ncbi:MAG: xanthine dehydrogenase family protein molybdopterin-binding subunit, partial [Betaproteobacteria bacterium]|nr:xanthine dehydrogenase family protein molybdopterin-binding subunit [Betaproteobacteria bacterium]